MVAWTAETERVRLLHDGRGVQPSRLSFLVACSTGDLSNTDKAVFASIISQCKLSLTKVENRCGEGYDDGYQRRDKSREPRGVDLRALASCTWFVRWHLVGWSRVGLRKAFELSREGFRPSCTMEMLVIGRLATMALSRLRSCCWSCCRAEEASLESKRMCVSQNSTAVTDTKNESKMQ